MPHVQHDYFSSFNQSNNWFVALLWSLLSSFLKLSIIFCTGWLNAGFGDCQFTTYHRERCTVARDILYVHHHHLISEVIGKRFCPFTSENTKKFTRSTSLVLMSSSLYEFWICHSYANIELLEVPFHYQGVASTVKKMPFMSLLYLRSTWPQRVPLCPFWLHYEFTVQ